MYIRILVLLVNLIPNAHDLAKNTIAERDFSYGIQRAPRVNFPHNVYLSVQIEY